MCNRVLNAIGKKLCSQNFWISIVLAAALGILFRTFLTKVWPVPTNLNEINFSDLSFLALVCSFKMLLSVLLEEFLPQNMCMSAPDSTTEQIATEKKPR